MEDAMADSKLAEGARLFAVKMNLGAYQEAAKIKSDLGLPNDMLIDAVRKAYDANVKKGDYSLCRRSG
jgi:hypothetical protein